MKTDGTLIGVGFDYSGFRQMKKEISNLIIAIESNINKIFDEIDKKPNLKKDKEILSLLNFLDDLTDKYSVIVKAK